MTFIRCGSLPLSDPNRGVLSSVGCCLPVIVFTRLFWHDKAQGMSCKGRPCAVKGEGYPEVPSVQVLIAPVSRGGPFTLTGKLFRDLISLVRILLVLYTLSPSITFTCLCIPFNCLEGVGDTNVTHMGAGATTGPAANAALGQNVRAEDEPASPPPFLCSCPASTSLPG